MKFLFSLVSLMLSFQAHADVCGRTPEIRIVLEKITNLNCSEINKEDLEQIKDLLLLSGDNISSLKSDDLGGLINLRTLLIQDSPLLTSLPQGLLYGLTKLESFILMRTSITTLPESFFWNLDSIIFIFLQENKLATLPAGLLQNLSSLSLINLSDNNLKTLPDAFFSNIKLDEAYLLNNPWAFFTAYTFKGAHIKYLDLGSENSTFAELPENLFYDAAFLESVVINFPLMASIPEKLFHGRTDLRTIMIEESKIKQLPKNLFLGLSSLKAITFTGSQIRLLPEELFSGLISLETLDLSGNWLETIPLYTFKDLKNLMVLSLNNNALVTLPTSLNLFDDLVLLRRLYLNDNKAEWTEEAMLYLKDRLPHARIWF